MIPKPLNEIEWSDIEALRDSGREEDDTIEYKASFSGGSDYLSFTDSQRTKAIEGIAREVVAFLNGRGGDVVIGVREAANDHPKIEEITPIQNIDQTVDRLGQSLAALIEPAQSVLALRAIRQTGGDTDGVVVVRCPSSLRAPHRFAPNKDCYTRRGRASVPMPMDEIQDLSVQRRRTLDQRQSLLLKQFDGMPEGRVRRTRLTHPRLHVRVAFLPLVETQIDFTDAFLHSLENSMPKLFVGDKLQTFDSPFTYISSMWRPTLRGRFQSYLEDSQNGYRDLLISREVGFNGVLVFDFANRFDLPSQQSSEVFDAVPVEWIIRFIAHSISMIKKVIAEFPQLQFGLLSLGWFSTGKMNLVWGQGSGRTLVDEGFVQIEPFEILRDSDLDDAFVQLQKDMFSLVEQKPPHLLTFESA
jgi:rhodanese-related sulfurtransferase